MEPTSGGPTVAAVARVDTTCTYTSGEAHVGEGNRTMEDEGLTRWVRDLFATVATFGNQSG